MRLTLIVASVSLLVLTATTPPSGGYNVGDKAKDFELRNIDGKAVSLKGLTEASGAIVIFTCNHCPFSVKYEDRIIALDKMYKTKGYPVIAINPNDKNREPDDSFENMIKRAKEKGFTFPYLYDETQDIAKVYGATRTPHVFVLKKTGADFIVEYIGAIDDNPNDAGGANTKYVEKAVNELIEGRKVAQNSTKAIGCTIKWKE